MPYLSFLAICIFWGMNFLLMKKSLLYFTPINVAALRLAGGGLFLLSIYLARKQRWPLTTNQVWGLLLLTLIGYAWPFGIQPYLIAHCGSGFIGMMVTLGLYSAWLMADLLTWGCANTVYREAQAQPPQGGYPGGGQQGGYQ